MKKILKFTVICLFCLKINAQDRFSKDSFIFEKSKIEYLTSGSSNSRGSFYVIIKNEPSGFGEFNECLKKCLRANKTLKYNNYYLIIPKEFASDKEKLILEFINYILGRTKLFESEMNIISDGNYFSLYEQTKLKNDTYRKNLIEIRKEIAWNKKSGLKSNPALVKKYDSLFSNRIDFQKYSYLNKIKTLTILKENEDFCDYIKTENRK